MRIAISILLFAAALSAQIKGTANAGTMSLDLRRAYFDNLDRWVFENKMY
ncbi:MAG TPA: hypothetical protein VGB09_09955 [Candidatus Binatia bacterium]